MQRFLDYRWVLGVSLLVILLAACATSPETSAGTPGVSGNGKNGGAQSAGSAQNPGGQQTTSVHPTATPRGVNIVLVSKQVPSTPRPAAALPTATPVPMQPPTLPATGGGNGGAAQAVFAAINQQRASAGLPALRWSTQLVQSAHQHNLTMAGANQLSHQLPGEAYFGDRERQAGVNWIAAGENIGIGYGDPTSSSVGLNLAMFNETPPDDGHRRNILSTGCTMVGVDVFVDMQHGRVWLTEDFAGV